MRRLIAGLALTWMLLGTAVRPVLADCNPCEPYPPIDPGPGGVAVTLLVLVTALALLFLARPHHDDRP